MTEKGVFFAGRQDGRRTFVFLDVALHRARPVAGLTSGRLFGRIDVSPDRLWLLASIIDEGIADLKLIEGFR